MLKMGFEEERVAKAVGVSVGGEWEQTTHLPLLSEGVFAPRGQRVPGLKGSGIAQVAPW